MKGIKFDCRKMGPNNLTNYSGFFGDKAPRWAFRYASGRELDIYNLYDPKTPINGVKEVYRYYANIKPTKDYLDKPEETKEADVVAVDKVIKN